MAKEVKDIIFFEDAIRGTLEADSANERKKGAEGVWREHLPISEEDVNALRQHDRNFALAFQRVAGREIIERLNGNTELNYARAYTEVSGQRYGIEIARHEADNATLEQKISGIAMTTTVQVHEDAVDALKSLAGMFK